MSATIRHTIPLPGCTPEPLMNYLKALGVLRLIAKQKDPSATGRWNSGIFTLTSTLDEQGLAAFFLNEYAPSPIMGPWAARSGFFKGTSEQAARGALQKVSRLARGRNLGKRFKDFRQVMADFKILLRRLGITEKASDEKKLDLLAACRSSASEVTLSWLDTCFVLVGEDRKFPPLLGTGGNEGSGSYVSGFVQQLVSCVIDREHDEAIEAALFDKIVRGVSSSQTPGHFSTTAAGGSNTSQGFEGDSRTNPWDYVLALEGTLLWASSAHRQHGSSGSGVAAFPFTAKISSVGPGSLAAWEDSKPKKAKREIAEMWCPLWERPTGLPELMNLLSEGRVSVNRRTGRTGLDFARAVVAHGVDRGISAFSRYAFLMRNGQSFMGVSLGMVAVHPRAEGDLLKEVEDWLNRFRSAATKKNKEDDEKRGSARFRSALRHVERAIFDYCQHGGTGMFQRILISLGRAEALIASAPRFREEAKGLRPIAPLSSAWIAAADDQSDEFRIALALASIFEPEPKVGSIRRNLEPVEAKGRFMAWAEKDRAVVWTAGDLPGNLAAILTRRAMDAERTGGKAHALKAIHDAPLSAVCCFLAGSLDESLIADLLWGLCLCDSRDYRPVSQETSDSQPLPSSYSLLKLLFLPPERDSSTDEAKVPNAPDARVLALLRANRLAEACQRAAQVLRGRSLLAQPQAMHGHPGRDSEWAETRWPGLTADHLAAALLIPIHPLAVESLEKRILRPAKPEAA
jgi:CRISPR-associated protein Csx17